MDYEVIVLGVGGMGSATCWQLAKRGVKAAGIDQFHRGHAHGSSHGQSRIIRKAYFEHPDYVPLLLRAYKIWQDLEREAGLKLYHETGIVYCCPPESELLRGLKSASETYQLTLETISQEDIAKWFRPRQTSSGLPYEVVREIEAGYLEVENCVRAATAQAEKQGAIFYENEKVERWSTENSGVVVTTNQRVLRAKSLVITAGAWTAQILKELNLPLKVRKKSMYWFQATSDLMESEGLPCFLNETPEGIFYGFPMNDVSQGMKIAEHTGGEPLQSPEAQNAQLDSEFERVVKYITDTMPGLTPQLLSHQPCMYTMTPDENFIIDQHPTHQNVFFAAGFSGHGFKFASVVGEILADLATTGSTKAPIGFLRNRSFTN
ncbi:MAG: N-methyl-L-tryptophan oxidase [Proteobacteria bacterium]|nr:MAG: N-methyl-L-tryptophan oxidase [Pseudomonadota bacterium]